jgi:hypothetical protein
MRKPIRPTHLSEFAERALQALATAGLGHRARLALETHLSRIAQHRPLADIPGADDRAEAAALRAWFTVEFLNALLD